jgi:hypothetical protein
LVLCGPAVAQNYEGKWNGEYKSDPGTPTDCPKGAITVSVSGVTATVDVSHPGGSLKMTGTVRSDGSFEAFTRLLNGTFVTFAGQFAGPRFNGIYGPGTPCPGTFAGSKT